MPTAALQFDLSDFDDERAHRYALAGRDALIALETIEQAIRSKLKYCELSKETSDVLEEIRSLLPYELLELLA